MSNESDSAAATPSLDPVETGEEKKGFTLPSAWTRKTDTV